ncbi:MULTISPECIES: SpoIIE family protein phosphatase [unclassified Streptomyces]|uniref:ATP-binding SpoIIE family protein phosphatase n=1 Tax=unclassified Streptomyces TaxID=2593676 RepID=UPI000F70F01B|nr:MULTISPECIES: SpoIIE family protein phosphatase [unclassified Streptomyces]AZM63932.1 PAS sensor protein [Streptomyces sp. WAC 01438]RSM99678.1 PAS sensor protein [Streptomyces sp. WAC 01420]
MEKAPAAVVVDARGIVTGWSEGARNLTGFPAEEAVGRAVRDLLAADVPPGTPPAPQAVVDVRHRDGRLVPLRLTVCPLSGEGEAPGGYVITVGPPGPAEPSWAGRAFQQASLAISVLDTEQRFVRLNDAACEAMGRPEEGLLGLTLLDAAGWTDRTCGVDRQLRHVAETGKPLHHESYGRAPTASRRHAWNVEVWPVRGPTGEVIGTAMAGLDSSEQHRARHRLALLNAAATAIGTTLDVVRTAEELVELLVPEFADFVAVDLLEWALGADEPPDGPDNGVVLRRVAHGSAAGDTWRTAVRLGRTDVHPPASPPARALREGRAVLARAGEPDFDRWIGERGPHAHGLTGVHSQLSVPLRARGTTLGVAVAVRTTLPDAFAPDDAVLAEELASRAAVCVDNARRFARERSTALTLQHSLLPRGLPGQAAVEVAHRYLPSASAAGIGGDWFDVIPLAGSRVALVVGDVVGHGIPSTATMGRLCTAVRTLADVDLPPDELLTHLDDLVAHLAADESDDVAEFGATCLYAVYDPVSRLLTAAAAGHPAPAVVLPDGTCRLVPVSAGPPLGVGGLPFEAVEVLLPEDSVIALYTDGLVEDRDRDIDQVTGELCRALAVPAGSLDALCDGVLKDVLPEEPPDDVVLLLARTRALGADRVATRDVAHDPEEVAAARQWAADMLAAWGLDESAFVTELVVSELVTNAIRYGEAPIRLRLIRDRSLICEVSDASSTSPHLRRAHAYDEGGRGLLLVAQLTQRWGSRQTDRGKTIWAEQHLPRH